MNRSIPTTDLRRGDTVIVRTGNDQGKQGRILKVALKRSAALVDGVQLVTRHMKPSTRAPKGGRIEKPSLVHVSNLQLVCPSCGKPTKTKMKLSATGRERICRLCNTSLVRKDQA